MVKEIRIHFMGDAILTEKNRQDVCHFFSTNHTIEHAEIGYPRDLLGKYDTLTTSQFELHELVNAALSCPALKLLHVRHLPLKVQMNEVSCSLQELTYETYPIIYTTLTDGDLIDSLSSIAELCKLPSMKTLKVDVSHYGGLPARVVQDFREKLRHRNPSMEEPELCGTLFGQDFVTGKGFKFEQLLAFF